MAFVVEDAQQRRGLGSILLEHLAAAAQERGIRRFTAEVLGENQHMVRVFIDAGYAVNREFDSGVVDLVFDIEPTAASRAVICLAEQRAESRSIARLLSPRSVAVIGASADRTKLGHAVLVNLLRGRVHRSGLPGEPGRPVGAGRPRLRHRARTSPIRSTSRWSPCRPRRWPRSSSPAGPRACTAWWWSPAGSPTPA